ncbi:MAG: sigma-70 family RNA polymerase sigma factor [Planctomycetes bacterium]|nr:sigma-70 family RNA polymerase sigma factor [Planctomycetota bacterium]
MRLREEDAGRRNELLNDLFGVRRAAHRGSRNGTDSRPAAVDGVMAAFDAHQPTPDLLRKHRAFARSLAWSLLHDEHEAEDVAQDALLASLRHPPRDDGGEPETTWRRWISVVTKNLVRDRSRAEAARRKHEPRTKPEEHAPSAQQIYEREAAARKVIDAVFALDEPSRSAILLRYYEDLPPRRIAERLGLPVETVRSRIKRGLTELRRTLAAEYGRGWMGFLVPLAGESARYTRPEIALALAKAGTMLAASFCISMTCWYFWPAGAVAVRDPRALEPASVGSSLAPGASPVGQATPDLASTESRSSRTSAAGSPAPVKSSAPLVHATGTVVKEDGSPAAHARIEATLPATLRSGEPTPRTQTDERVGETTCDERGQFSIDLPVRSRTAGSIVISEEGSLAKSLRILDLGEPREERFGVIRLCRPGRAKVRFVNAGGQPIRLTFDTAWASAEQPPDDPRIVPSSGYSDSRWTELPTFEQLEPGSYTIRVRLSDASEPVIPGVVVRSGEETVADLQYDGPDPGQILIVRLRTKLLFVPSASSSMIRLEIAGEPPRSPEEMKPSLPLQYQFRGVPPGEHTLVVDDPRYALWRMHPVRGGDRPVDVQLVGDSKVSLRVIDDQTSRPIERFSATLRLHQNSKDAQFGFDSKVLRTLEDKPTAAAAFSQIPAIDHTWIVHAPGYGPAETPVLGLKRGEAREIVVRLQHAGAVQGIVQSRDGQPLREASVRLFAPAARNDSPSSSLKLRGVLTSGIEADSFREERYDATTDGEGRFRIEGIAPGTYCAVAFLTQEFYTKTEGVVIQPGEFHKPLILQIDEPARASATVIGPAGADLSQIGIRIDRQSPDVPMESKVYGLLGRSTQTVRVAHGRFDLGSLPPGMVTLAADLLGAEGGSSLPIDSIPLPPMRLKPGPQELTLDLRDRWPGFLHVRIKDPSSLPRESLAWAIRAPSGRARVYSTQRAVFDASGMARIGPVFGARNEEEAWCVGMAGPGNSWVASAEARALLPGASEAEVVLDPKVARGSIRVLLDETGEPMRRTGVKISFMPELGLSRIVRTDENGLLEMEMPPTRFILQRDLPGLSSKQVSVDWPASGPPPMEVRLP